MRYYYLITKFIISTLLFIFIMDAFKYYYAYDKLITSLISIKTKVAMDLGISENLKSAYAKNDIYFIYEKSNGNIGDLFTFSIYTKADLVFSLPKKVKIDVVVILGY